MMLACFVPFQASAIEVVSNIQVPDVSLTQSQLRRIYTMRQLYWSDGTAVTVFVLPSQHELHHQFAKEQLQIFPYQLNRIWNKLTYSGLGVAPTVMVSEQALIQAVINTPGSIGYIYDKSLMHLTRNDSENASDTIIKQQVSGEGVVNVINIQD